MQGIEEYFGVFNSTAYWRDDGIKYYYRRLSNRPDTLDTNFGLTVHDPYNDGFLMLNFLHEECGREAIFALLADKEPSFGRRLQKTTKMTFDQFLERVSRWKEEKIRRLK